MFVVRLRLSINKKRTTRMDPARLRLRLRQETPESRPQRLTFCACSSHSHLCFGVSLACPFTSSGPVDVRSQKTRSSQHHSRQTVVTRLRSPCPTPQRGEPEHRTSDEQPSYLSPQGTTQNRDGADSSNGDTYGARSPKGAGSVPHYRRYTHPRRRWQ